MAYQYAMFMALTEYWFDILYNETPRIYKVHFMESRENSK